MTAPPRVFPGLHSTAKNHPAEAHRHKKRAARSPLLQCAKCGAVGTVFEREDDLNVLGVYDGRQRVVTAAWKRAQRATLTGDEAEALRWERTVRDLRRGKPVLCHKGCGGLCRAYDSGSM